MKLKIHQKSWNTLKKGVLGPILGFWGKKMSQKSSFSNCDETFHFYPIFHLEYEYETQNSSKALKNPQKGVFGLMQTTNNAE